jgi:excinuclease ABC subunit C
MIREDLKDIILSLPSSPGVYIYKDIEGKVIYVGKAINLKKRVSSYFQKQHHGLYGYKIDLLVASIASIETIMVNMEMEALFLEAELIKRYKPKYNVLSRDDKNYLYVRISRDRYPVIDFVRQKYNDKSSYYGPFSAGSRVRSYMFKLRRIYPFITHSSWPKYSSKLEMQIGTSPPIDISTDKYHATIKQIKQVLSGRVSKRMTTIKREISSLSNRRLYEEAAELKKEYDVLHSFSNTKFSEESIFSVHDDSTLTALAKQLGISSGLKRIECFDISNLSYSNIVASMIVFINGLPSSGQYRHFKIRGLNVNDDFASMKQVISRRIKHEQWGRADLIIVDGGKGQLSAALEAIKESNYKTHIIGLAKRLETIITFNQNTNSFEEITLGLHHPVTHLLQRIRDEAHRFAITFQRQSRNKDYKSQLLGIKGVGEKTVQAVYGQFKGQDDILKSKQNLVALIGAKKARDIINFFENNM